MHICDLCGKSENVRLVKDIYIAPAMKACQKVEGREEIYQGRKPQEYSCIARLSDAEKFSIWQVLLAMFSWGSNICEKCRRNLVKIYILSNDKSKPKHIIKRKSVFYTGLFTIFALVMLMVKILT